AIITILILVLATSGCEQIEPQARALLKKKKSVTVQEQAPLVSMMDDTRLAKLILKPKPYELKVTRDPFKPLIERSDKSGGQLPAGNADLYKVEQDKVSKMRYLGVFKIGDQYSALIRTEKKKSVFKINDDIEGFTVMEIHEDHIIL